MIYRIHHDENYLMHVVPPVESMNKLGPEHGTFAFSAEPKVYAAFWKPLHLEFRACDGRKTQAIPDISEDFGRLFLSTRAYEILATLLEPCGECLAVTYDNGGEGYIFNPLVTAEELNTLDENLTTHDEHGNLENFGFNEQKLKDTTLFKTQLDTFKGIFCHEAIKQAYDGAGLTGIRFHADVSNPIGEAYGASH